jgi:hypothetical protein
MPKTSWLAREHMLQANTPYAGLYMPTSICRPLYWPLGWAMTSEALTLKHLL